MNFIKRLFKGILMTATMLASMTLASGQTGIAPNIRFLETDQTLPDGLWRIRLDGDILTIQKNTNASNNFSTATTAISIAANGDVTIPNDFFVTGSATVSVDTSVIGDLEVTGTIRGANSSSYALLNEASSDSNPTLIPNRASSTTGIGAVIGEGESLHVVIQGSNRVQFNSAQMVVAVDTVMNGRLDVLGDGTDQVTLFARGGSGQTLDLLRVQAFPSVDVLTIGVDGAVEAGDSSGWALLNEAATAINPTVAPNRLLLGTGISAVDNEGAGSFHIVVDDISRMLLSADTARITSLLTTTGALFVDGISDQIQMRVDAHSTQTSQILRVRNSSFATIFNINDDGSFSFPNAISNIGIGAAPTISEAMNIELFIEGPSDNSKLVGIRVENFVLGAAADIVWVAVASIEGAVEVTAAVTTMDVAQLVIGEPFLQISGAGSVTDESNLLIDRIGTSGDHTYGIKILPNNSTPATAAIFIGGAAGSSPRVSEAIVMQRNSDAGLVDWKFFTEVTNVVTGASQWTLQQQLAEGGYATKLFVSDASSTLGLPDDIASIQLGAALDAQIHRGNSADIIEQRRGLNDQRWHIYENFVSFADYDRLAIYIGGGPPAFEAVIRPESTDALQGINLTVESLAVATGEGFLTLRGGTSGATFLLATAAQGAFGRFTGGEFQFATVAGVRISGLIQSVGVLVSPPGIGIKVDVPPQGASNFADSHSINLIGAGENANRATWRSFVDVLDTSANSIWTLQNDQNGGGFSDRLTVDDTGLQVITGTHEIFFDAGNNFTLNLPAIWLFGSTGNTPLVNNYALASNGTTVTVVNSGSGGTVINRIENANKTVLTVNQFTHETAVLIDITNTEALLVRQNGDGGDVFTVDTINDAVRLASDSTALHFGAAGDAQIHRGNSADVIEQRRGANSQKWNIYDNFTSFSDYDRLGIYIGGGPPLITAIIRPESTDATQGINILIEALSNSFSQGTVTLLAGTSGASLTLNPVPGNSAQFTGGTFTFSEDIFLRGLIASVGDVETTPGVGLLMRIASIAAPGFRDSHSIDLQGRGGGARSSTWRTFVDIVNQAADSIYTLQHKELNDPAFSDIMTIDDTSDLVIENFSAMTLTGQFASFTALTPEFTSPNVGLFLDTAPLTGASQRDSNSIRLVGQAHDGAVSRSTRWQWFVDVTNNSANSTLRLQHSIAGQAFLDFLLVDQTGSLILARTSPRLFFGDSLDVILRRDTEGNGELGFRNGTNPQVFNIYNTFTADANKEFAEIGWKPVSNTFVIGTVKGSSGGTARPISIRTDEIEAINISTTQLVSVGSANNGQKLLVVGQSPNLDNNAQVRITSGYLSGGVVQSFAQILHVDSTLTGATGDISHLNGVYFEANIVTQTATQSILDISQLRIDEPNITDNLTGGGLITNAQSLLITSAPTEGVNNFALRVVSGLSQFRAIDVVGDIDVSGGITLTNNNGIFWRNAADSSNIFVLAVNATDDTILNADVGNLLRLQVNTTNVMTFSSTVATVAGNLVVSGVGPHAISGAAFGAVQLIISDTFTSDGSSTLAAGLFHTPTIVGAAGDTTSLTGTFLTAAITTQTATESIANISQLQINEPFITDNLTGSITDAQSLLITGAPTEGDRNYALKILSGGLRLGYQFR